MKTLTQAEIILKYLAHGDWVWGFNIPSRETNWGFIGSDAVRVCRKLAEKKDGRLEKREALHNGHSYIQYRINRYSTLATAPKEAVSTGRMMSMPAPQMLFASDAPVIQPPRTDTFSHLKPDGRRK